MVSENTMDEGSFGVANGDVEIAVSVPSPLTK
jgi:hypothetical protein